MKHSQTLTVGLLRAFGMLVDAALQEGSQRPSVPLAHENTRLDASVRTIRPAAICLLPPSLTTEERTVQSLMTTHSVHRTRNRTKTVYPLCLILVVKSFNINRPYISEQF